MMQDDNDKKSKDQGHAIYTARLPSDFSQTLRQSLTKSLVEHYPVEEMTPDLVEMLKRLDKQKP